MRKPDANVLVLVCQLVSIAVIEIVSCDRSSVLAKQPLSASIGGKVFIVATELGDLNKGMYKILY